MCDCIERGLHSNIPLCCAISYCNDEAQGVVEIAKERYSSFQGFEENYEFDYVPCARCWEQYRKENLVPNSMHRCSVECGSLNQRA